MPSQSQMTFADAVSYLSDGAFEERATELLTEIAAAVDETGGSGKLTITLSLKKTERALVVQPKFRVSRPEPALADTNLYRRPDGSLSGDAPQLKLPKVSSRIVPIDGKGGKDN